MTDHSMSLCVKEKNINVKDICREDCVRSILFTTSREGEHVINHPITSV